MKNLFYIIFVVCLFLIFGCAQQKSTQTDENKVEVPVTAEIGGGAVAEGNAAGINLAELSQHNTMEDCWVVYESKVYDLSNAPKHPSMEKTFYAHCGKESGFEEGAKARHSGSNQERVENYAAYVGEYKG